MLISTTVRELVWDYFNFHYEKGYKKNKKDDPAEEDVQFLIIIRLDN
jgi:hypothetical protein